MRRPPTVDDPLPAGEAGWPRLGDKRNAVIELRDRREIDDTVLRRLQTRLDREEVRLAGVADDD